MNLKIQNETFLVLGATGGFGKAVSDTLLDEGARVLGVARSEQNLDRMENQHDGFKGIVQNIFAPEGIKNILEKIHGKPIRGVLVNAGGPPAATARDATLTQWDDAYQQVLRWKIELVHGLIPHFQSLDYARMVFLESASIRQPIENLVLSNSLRMAIAGFIKTLAIEMAESPLTFNILAPGYHHTDAINRLVKKKAEGMHITEEKSLELIREAIPSKKLGKPEDFASLAAWLFSPYSSYVNGQVFYLDGGMNRSNL